MSLVLVLDTVQVAVISCLQLSVKRRFFSEKALNAIVQTSDLSAACFHVVLDKPAHFGDLVLSLSMLSFLSLQILQEYVVVGLMSFLGKIQLKLSFLFGLGHLEFDSAHLVEQLPILVLELLPLLVALFQFRVQLLDLLLQIGDLHRRKLVFGVGFLGFGCWWSKQMLSRGST